MDTHFRFQRGKSWHIIQADQFYTVQALCGVIADKGQQNIQLTRSAHLGEPICKSCGAVQRMRERDET